MICVRIHGQRVLCRDEKSMSVWERTVKKDLRDFFVLTFKWFLSDFHDDRFFYWSSL